MVDDTIQVIIWYRVRTIGSMVVDRWLMDASAVIEIRSVSFCVFLDFVDGFEDRWYMLLLMVLVGFFGRM